MRSSDLWVRRFRSAAQERAFLRDYAQRLSGQRRLAIAIFTALWIVFSIRDFGRIDILDPAHLHHHEIIFVRSAAAIGMSVAVVLWTPRALDERWAVGLLCLWTLSAWLATLRLLQIVDLPWQEALSDPDTHAVHDLHGVPASCDHGGVAGRAVRRELSAHALSSSHRARSSACTCRR